MKFNLLLITSFVIMSNVSFGQTDSTYTSKYINRSTKFAWTTFGGDFLMLGSGSTSFSNNGITQQVDFNPTFIPRLTIGGIHFWGHADFFVSFPLSFLAFQQKSTELKNLEYQQGIETGLKIYPLALKQGKVRPYIGTSFRLLSFKQELKGSNFQYGGTEFQKMIFPLQGGLSYVSSKYIFNFGLNYQSLSTIHNYITPDNVGEVKFNPISFQLGITRYIDADRSMRTPKAVERENLKYKILDKEKRLSTWYWGLGPSAGLQMSKSSYLKENYPHLYDNFIGGFMPDITFGRFFNKPDMNVGLSYRTLGSTLQGFDDKINIRRHSIMLESYKNLFNWLGFVPFAGLTASIENLNVNVNGQKYSETKPAIGFIFGWDIRVTKTGTSLLRTNLRWTPNLHIAIDNNKMMFDNLEFNFIQWVQFLGRKRIYKKYL
jgi:hypothetical protein